MANGFSSRANKSRMGSNVFTTQNQGGGSKKAGFPYQIGREHWTSIFLHSTAPTTGRCCSLNKMQFTLSPGTNPSRNIGSTYVPNTYFHIPGTR
jgi:hypothetical protein